MGKAKKQKSQKEAPQPQLPTKLAVFPKISPKDLVRTPILGSEIFVVRDMFTEQECHQMIAFAESLGFQHQGSRGSAFQEAVRDNDRISLHDPLFAEQLWKHSGLNALLSDISVNQSHAVGLNPHFRIYRYSKGQRFGRHIDESVPVDEATTQYTLLIYLSGQRAAKSSKKPQLEPLRGGETIFYGRKNRVLASIAPEMGMALLHIHGDHCHEHEGAQVLGGVKYVLRTDVLFSPKAL